MAKNYTDQLGEWVKKRSTPKRDKNVVAFLAVRDDVKAAIAAGYAVKTIWTNMHEIGRITFGYDTFLNYVNRQLRAAEDISAAETLSEKPVNQQPSKTVEQAPEKGKAERPSVLPGFKFNSKPDAKDII